MSEDESSSVAGVFRVLRALETQLSPRRHASNLLTRAFPPPVSDAYIVASLAMSVFDELAPLKYRFHMVSTAVRLLASSPVIVHGEALVNAGLCGLLNSSTGVDVCNGGDVKEMLVEVVNNYESGARPLSNQALRVIAQAILVLVAPELRRVYESVIKARPEY
jgi:hypothetical protein